jgi:hypothetical protein
LRFAEILALLIACASFCAIGICVARLLSRFLSWYVAEVQQGRILESQTKTCPEFWRFDENVFCYSELQVFRAEYRLDFVNIRNHQHSVKSNIDRYY